MPAGKKMQLLIFNIISFAVFGGILFGVYSSSAWQSNVAWMAIYIIAIIFSYTEQHLFTQSHYIFVGTINTVLAFCLIGNYVFCYPVGKHISWIDFLLFGVFALVCSPITICLGTIPNKLGRWMKVSRNHERLLYTVKPKKLDLILHFVTYLLFPMVIGAIGMYALNPCIVSYDAYEVIAEAYGIAGVQDYAGILYVLLYKGLLHICDSIVFLCVFQVLLFSIINSVILIQIERHYKMRFSIILPVYAIFLALPNNIMMLVTLSKDVYYACALLFLLYSLFMIYCDSGGKGNYIRFGLALVFTFNIRQSGIVVVILVVLVGFFIVKRRIAFITAGLISLVLSICFTGVISDTMQVQETPAGMKYVAMFQDILGVYYAGGDVTQETVSMIQESVEDVEEFEMKYTPYWAYYDYFYLALGDVDVYTFIENYIKTFVQNPVLMTKSILCRNDMMWDFRPGINARETWQWMVENNGGNWTYLVKEREENSLTEILNVYGRASTKFPYKDIVWRVGIWNFATFLSGMCAIKKEKKRIIIFLPFAGYLVSYLVSLGWGHYRYFWADELMAFYLVLGTVGMLLSENDNYTKERENEAI